MYSCFQQKLWASSNRITDFLWVEVIIDKSINDGRELRFYQSIAGSHKVRQDGTQGRTNLSITSLENQK